MKEEGKLNLLLNLRKIIKYYLKKKGLKN